MSTDTSARLSLPYLAAGQLQKHVTLNQALTRLDALLQTAVASRTTTDQPTTAPDGSLYILPAEATGPDWSVRDPGDLMRFEAGGWTRISPTEGMIATVIDTEEVVVRRAGIWSALGGTASAALQDITRLGINTVADAVNPFSAKLNKALWTALETGEDGDGDLRMTFNKQGDADVLSLLFQSGYGGRAELGLIGDDDLRLKVSADGSIWRDALSVDRATGRVWFERGAGRAQTTTLTADGDYAVPAWARRLDVVAVGGGGGGGSGASGAAGTSRYGGGGGGAGGISVAQWSTDVLPNTLQIVVGAGGSGGAGIVSGVGLDGFQGQATSVSAGGSTVLMGAGGGGGSGGTAAAGIGGSGGQGVPSSNAGGASSTVATAFPGDSLTRPDGSGGGGGGGGLSSTNAARAGGTGGVGAVFGLAAAGGAGVSGAVGASGSMSANTALSWASGGGGGGAATAGGAGHAGGQGTTGGSGGGGGGSGTTVSGSGGSGGVGLVRITAIG